MEATVIYPPTQAADGIKLARLIAQGKGMSDLVQVEVPEADRAERAGGHQGQRRRVPATSASSPDRRRVDRAAPAPTGPARRDPHHRSTRRSIAMDRSTTRRPRRSAWSATPSWAPPTPRPGAPRPASSTCRCTRACASSCGRDAARAAEAAAPTRLGRAPRPTGATSIARDDIDLVDICTPGDTHAEIAIAALEAGKHVLCEKPLANTVAEAEAMAEAAERAAAQRRAGHGRASPTAACPAIALAATARRRGPDRRDPARAGAVPAGLARRPARRR